LRAVTNRMSGSQPDVELDCRVEMGPIRASVFERNGRKVRQLNALDGQGLLTVRWDGRNDAGERVRPGVYVVVVDFDGRQEKVNVLLE
jgi:flagellar hook assembly protein FlgD